MANPRCYKCDVSSYYLSCFSAPQGLLCPAWIHLYLALLLHRDYFRRSDSSLPCSFSPQGLFLPPGCISILLFCSTKIISAGRMHLYLALFFHRDDFAPVRCVPSLRTSLPGHSVNFRKTPESMFLILRHAGCATEAKLPTLIRGIRRIQPIA